MALTHSRSSSPEPDGATLKKRKTSHANSNGAATNGNSTATTSTNTLPAEADPTSQFATDLFDHTHIAKLHNGYKANGPFKYALVEKLFQDELLKKVKDECLSELSFTEKETDIYKVNQTGDLASLNYLTSSQISLLPSLLTLRNALYSSTFRSFLRAVTGCGPLSGTKQDMSVNSYTKGCHLLNHDDVIGTRRVSYILYMPLPHYQFWQKDWGGALELYPVKEAADGGLEPESVPTKSIPPSWNQFIFFEVQPGQSFHSVEEVVVGGEGEDGRERLSISGWFHAAQEGEEGYVPDASEGEFKSSREQLTSTSTAFTAYPSPEVLPDSELSPEQITFLSEFMNPVYLQPRTMNALAARFVEESSLELHSFLYNDLAQALEPRLRDLDAKDGLGPDRSGRIPPHSAGVDLSSTVVTASNADAEGVDTILIDTTSRSALANGHSNEHSATSPWSIKGPPHKWRYCVLAPPNPSAPATSITPLSAHPSPSEILRSLQDELFPSQAFRAWLAIVSRLMPLRHSVEARRFRPGLDYTLATSEENEARLDVVLGLTPGVAEEDGSPVRGWAAAEWGGWECYMAPHDEEDDPAVYRAGTVKRPKNVSSSKEAANSTVPNGVKTDVEDSAISPKPNGKKASSNSNSPEPVVADGQAAGSGDAEEDMDAEEEEEVEEDSTLLTVQPGFNRLLLVLRDERVMRFVKYVSAAAEGSRWDVCGEYEAGVMQEAGESDGAEEDV